LWSLTDTELAAEISDALALRAQTDAALLARLGEADARGLAPGAWLEFDDGVATRLTPPGRR